MKLIVDDYNESLRLDAFLAEYLQDYSRSKIQSEIKAGSVVVNSKSVKPSYILKFNDCIEVNIEEKCVKIEPENIDLDIVYEDEDRHAISSEKLPERLGVALHAVGAADDEYRRIKHRERPFGLGREINVSGSVKKREPRSVKLHYRLLRENGYAARTLY